jgi:hypothetical protein
MGYIHIALSAMKRRCCRKTKVERKGETNKKEKGG